MSRYKRIGLDVDDVLVEFNSLVLDKVNERFETNYKVEELEWDFVNLKSEHKLYAHSLFSSSKFFSQLVLPTDSIDFIAELQDRGVEVILVTSVHPYVASMRFNMFKDLGLDFVYTSRKELVDVDVLIDDSPKHAAAAPEKVCLLNKPWNLTLMHEFRIDSLVEFLTLLDKEN